MNHSGHSVRVSFKSVARFTIVRQMAPLLCTLSGDVENNLITAISVILDFLLCYLLALLLSGLPVRLIIVFFANLFLFAA